MPSDNTLSIKLTPASVGYALSILALLAYGWNAVSYVKDQEAKDQMQDMRLDRTDRDRSRNIESINKLTDKTGELNESIVRLTTVIETKGLTKKAELPPLPDEGMIVTPTEFTLQK